MTRLATPLALALGIVALGVVVALGGCADERSLGGVCTTDCTGHVHPAGNLDPMSDDFHPKMLERHDWDFKLCASCHSDDVNTLDFKGGKAKKSCLKCHDEGPTACKTCHGGGPTSNAHPAHAAHGVTCSNCHVVPTKYSDVGHILDAAGVAIPLPARVKLGDRANITLNAADRAGPAAYDPATKTCKNVYCHGDALHAAGGTASEPRWDDPAPQNQCDRCHGNPPPTHLRNDCATCHPATAPHVDGVINIGRGPVNSCGGCHGSSNENPAPPVDLHGNTSTSEITVGAHQIHLNSRISAPVACSACHLVPVNITDSGHLLPSPAVVNTSVGWDRTSATCTTSSCHGTALFPHPSPVWTTSTPIACGACHGLPPNTPSHNPTMTNTTCAGCHPESVDAYGNPLSGGSSKHINGIVDHI
jgi:predicted CxxxxCH...CXXCH cytochrome family protein